MYIFKKSCMYPKKDFHFNAFSDDADTSYMNNVIFSQLLRFNAVSNLEQGFKLL